MSFDVDPSGLRRSLQQPAHGPHKDRLHRRGGRVQGSDQLLNRNNRDPETNQHQFF